MTLRPSQMALLALYAAPQIVLASEAAPLPADSQIVVVDAKPNASAPTTLADATTGHYEQQQHRVVVSSAEVAAANAGATQAAQNVAQQAALPTADKNAPQAINEDLWLNMRANFYMDRYNPEVQRWANWYASHPQHVYATLARSEKYLWHITEAVRDRGMPMEIAMLPGIESAFQSKAFSHAKASGLWQFMPQTGKRFNLDQNEWFDGRRDFGESTRAALEYLSFLHGMFGDWQLALAAYNCGEGRVQSAIRKNQAAGLPTNFWSLSLPRETRDYVPKLLGLVEVVARSEAYGFSLNPVNRSQALARVELPGPVDLGLAADLAGISVDEMYRLNPGFKRWITNPDPSKTHYLWIPQAAADGLRSAIATLPSNGLVKWREHIVNSGEKLPQLARMYGVSVNNIRALNNLSSNTLFDGQSLLVPVSHHDRSVYRGNVAPESSAVPNEVAAVSRSERRREKRIIVADRDSREVRSERRERAVRQESESTVNVSSGVLHQVSRGETLQSIARRYGVTVNALREWNGLSKRSTLKRGRTLSIQGALNNISERVTERLASRDDRDEAPRARHSSKKSGHDLIAKADGQKSRHERTEKAIVKTKTHTVSEGDTLWNIAARYSVSLSELRQWNDISGTRVRKGQKLRINMN